MNASVKHLYDVFILSDYISHMHPVFNGLQIIISPRKCSKLLQLNCFFKEGNTICSTPCTLNMT
jgi:hypothetical protein